MQRYNLTTTATTCISTNAYIADVYITKDFSIINDNNFKLLDKVFNLTKSKRGRKPKKQEVA